MRINEIVIVLIDRSNFEASLVRAALYKSMGSYCTIHHFNSSEDAVEFLKKDDTVDIVVLDLPKVLDKNPREVFRKVNVAGQDIPVIVFTKRSEHNLAISVVNEGAADNVVLEDFHANPKILRDAILFSLARNDIILDVKKEHEQVVHMLTGGYSLVNNQQDNIEAKETPDVGESIKV
jgi:DNA-binding NtrC family response regulator